MDASRKPKMSRELMQRIVSSQPAKKAETPYGGVPTSLSRPVRRSLNQSGKNINGYGTSYLGRQTNIKQFGTEISAPSNSKYNNNDTNQPQSNNISSADRRTQNLQDKQPLTFREPPSRGYDPDS